MTEGPPIDAIEPGQTRVQGAAGRGPTPSNVAPLRLPGHLTPEAHAVAIERMFEAMCLAAAVNRVAAEAYKITFRIATVSAPFGEHGPTVERLLKELARRFDAYLATLPNQPPPAA
jgi:hypothetical protein